MRVGACLLRGLRHCEDRPRGEPRHLARVRVRVRVRVKAGVRIRVRVRVRDRVKVRVWVKVNKPNSIPSP